MQIRTAAHLTKLSATPFGAGIIPAAGMPAGTHMVLRKGEQLFEEGDETEFFYQVVSGAIRSYKLLSDGRRQIDAFHLRGDIFGLEAGGEHRFRRRPLAMFPLSPIAAAALRLSPGKTRASPTRS